MNVQLVVPELTFCAAYDCLMRLEYDSVSQSKFMIGAWSALINAREFGLHHCCEMSRARLRLMATTLNVAPQNFCWASMIKLNILLYYQNLASEFSGQSVHK